MIKIVMTGMCEGCSYADLELVYEPLYGSLNGLVAESGKRWGVKCIHRDACDFTETMTIERLKGNTDDVHMS